MAYIPVNPERRDPGYFKKKAEIGLPNVDNMSAAEFVSAVSGDIKSLENKKKLSSKITKRGEFYGGILKTARRSSHSEFTLGLFDSSNPSKELASVHVDFAFSCSSSDELGKINYTIGCPDEDIYLKDLYLVFSQVQDQVYVTLHSTLLPIRSSQSYFNIIGINLIEWTEGVERLDPSKDISDIIGNNELARIRLNGPSSTVGSDSATSLAVYDEEGRKVFLDNIPSLENLDYPSINGVPFIGKKNLKIGNEEAGRQIIIPAFHKNSTREGSGLHDWEVLGDLKKINIEKDVNSSIAVPKKSSKMPNFSDKGYGLVKPSKYKILPSASINLENLTSWLNGLGEDTDVITVGAFKEYMSYLLRIISNQNVNSHHLYLKNSEDLFKYIPFEGGTFDIPIYSFLKKIGSTADPTPVQISVDSSEDWIECETDLVNGVYNLSFKVTPNPERVERTAVITISQIGTERTLDITIVQELFEVRYGVLFSETPVYEDSGYSIPRWDNQENSQIFTVTPIKTDANDVRGYSEIKEYQEFTLTNNNSWITEEFEDGETEGNLKLSVGPNTSSLVRTGVIYFGILETSGEKVKYIPVKCSQSSTTPYLSINESENPTILCTVGKEETTERFLVSSNYGWEVVENTVPSWITLSGYTGPRPSGSSYLTLVVSENNTQSNRESEIKIINKGGIQRILKVNQSQRTVYIDINNQAQDQYFCFGSNNELTLSSITLEVNSNINWFIDQCPSWITPNMYNGGSQGQVTKTNLTLNVDLKNSPKSSETVSLAYYNEETDTIYALRKIIVIPNTPEFEDSGDLILPQTTLTPKVISEGGIVKIGAYSSIKYKLKFLDNNWINMLEGDYISDEVPTNYTSSLTNLTLSITKNNTSLDRSFKFILIPYNSDPDSIENVNDYPVFTITQAGNKEIYPFTYEDSTVINTNLVQNVFVNAVSGEIVANTEGLLSQTVYEPFYVEEGKVLKLNGVLYKSSNEIISLGDIVKRVDSVFLGGTEVWYRVKESGYYFSTTGEACIITPKVTRVDYDSMRTEFNLTLLSTMNNRWDLYNNSLPGWISLEKISGSSSYDNIRVIIDENVTSEPRECVLQFYVDALDKSVSELTIRQLGLNIDKGDVVCESVLPVVSSGKTVFTSSAFEIGLSALVDNSSLITVNGTEHRYTYSEYKNTGVEFSVKSNVEGVLITLDTYGKPKLVVSKNDTAAPRTITITATYNEVSGDLTILQGSSEVIQFYTYSDLVVEPDFTTIPLGISEFGIKIKGTVSLNTLDLTTGNIETISISQENTRIRFPYLYSKDRFKINDSGFTLVTPETLEYSGLIKDKVVISYPVTKYSLREGELIERTEFVDTPEIIFEGEAREGSYIDSDFTVLSGDSIDQVLPINLSFNDNQEILVKKLNDKSMDIYLSSSIRSLSETFTKPTKILTTIKSKVLGYLENKTITYTISDPSNPDEILKYLHVRNMRSLPKIECNTLSSTYSNEQTFSEIQVSSNIGYTSSSWSNNPSETHIQNGDFITPVNPEGSRVIIYTSSSQPSRKWYKKYATESLMITDSDNYGITKEVPIVLPSGVNGGGKPGFKITMGDKVITPFNTGSSSCMLSIPAYGGDEVLKIRSYDSYSITYQSISAGGILGGSGIIGSSISSSVSPFTVEDSRNWIQKKVGSLDEMDLTIGYHSGYSGKSSIYRGYVKISSGEKEFTINVYQSPLEGTATITSPSTKIMVIDKAKPTASLGFIHNLPGWQIVPLDVNNGWGSSTILYPKFNGQTFNVEYGMGGGSGNTWSSERDKSTSLSLDFSEVLNDVKQNNSLELKPISDLMMYDSYHSPGVYGIKTAEVNNLQESSSSIKTTDEFEVMIKPAQPAFSVYQMVENELKEAADWGELSLKPLSDIGINRDYILEFYVESDLFGRTENYINSSIEIDGEITKIIDVDTVYNKLSDVNVIYEDRVYGKKKYTISPIIVDINGKKYAKYTKSWRGTDLNLWIGSGSVTVSMNGFTVNRRYYYPSDGSSRSFTLKP